MNKDKDNLVERLEKLAEKVQNIMTEHDLRTVQDAIYFIQYSDKRVNVEEGVKRIRKHENSFGCSEGIHMFPVYLLPYTYAAEHDEIDEYRRSLQENELCAKDIELALKEQYDSSKWHLNKECIFPVLRKFGYERICWVLAYYIQKHEADGRISIENKAWAKTYSFPEKNAFDGNIHISSHVGLVDIFTNLIRKWYEQVQELVADLKEYFGYNELDELPPDVVLKQALRDAGYNELEPLLLDGKVQLIRDFFVYELLIAKYYATPTEKRKKVDEEFVNELYHFVVQLNAISPVTNDTVVKYTANFGMDWCYQKIRNAEPDTVKMVFEKVIHICEDDKSTVRNFDKYFTSFGCKVGIIGDSEYDNAESFPSDFADFEFCIDTESITDLHAKK